MLLRVPMYFDDIDELSNHRFAGERLAIEEFNAENVDVKIDRWHGVYRRRPFPDADWLHRMFMAHDLLAISRSVPQRAATVEPPLKLR